MSKEFATQTRVELDAQVMLDEMTAFTRGVNAAAQEFARKRLREAEAEWLFGPADPELVEELVFERRAAAAHDIDAMARRVPTADEIYRHTGMSVTEYDDAMREQEMAYDDMCREALAVAGGI